MWETYYNLLITNQRLIAGKIGVVWLRRIGQVVQAASLNGSKYRGWEPEQMARADQENLVFDFQHIKRFEMAQVLWAKPRLIIHQGSGEKVEFWFDKKYQAELTRVLQNVAGSLVA